MIFTVQRDIGVHGMKFVIKGVLMGLVVGMAGCNSHDSKQVTNSDKPATSRAAANKTRGNVESAPVVNAGAANQVADQAKGVINTAAATADNGHRHGRHEPTPQWSESNRRDGAERCSTNDLRCCHADQRRGKGWK